MTTNRATYRQGVASFALNLCFSNCRFYSWKICYVKIVRKGSITNRIIFTLYKISIKTIILGLLLKKKKLATIIKTRIDLKVSIWPFCAMRTEASLHCKWSTKEKEGVSISVTWFSGGARICRRAGIELKALYLPITELLLLHEIPTCYIMRTNWNMRNKEGER